MTEEHNEYLDGAVELDNLGKKYADRLTLVEAFNISAVYGRHLEYCGSFRVLFAGSVLPQSLLPFPRDIIAGAITKLIKHYEDENQFEHLQALREGFVALLAYCDDVSAFQYMAKHLSETDLYKSFVEVLRTKQLSELTNGYLLEDNTRWSLQQERLVEILSD